MELQGFVLFLLKCECGRPIQGLADLDQPIWWPSDVAFEDDLLKKASKKGVTLLKLTILTSPDTLCLKIQTKFLLLTRYKPTLILKPLMMLFRSLKILINSCRFFLCCTITELRRIFKGQKSM